MISLNRNHRTSSGTETNVITFPLVSEYNQRSTSLTLKLGLLQHFDLPDVDVVQGVDGLACLFNVLANAVWDPESNQKCTKLVKSSVLRGQIRPCIGLLTMLLFVVQYPLS